MTFISMVFVFIAVLVVLGGFIMFVIGLILATRRHLRMRKGKETGRLSKIFTVLLCVAGTVTFVIPVSLMVIGTVVSRVSHEKEYESLPNKVFEQSWQGGFTMGGKELVPIDFILREYRTDGQTGKKGKTGERDNLFGAVVYGDKRYYKVYSLMNDGGFDLYEMDETFDYFCEKGQVEAARRYYYEDAALYTRVYHGRDDDMYVIDMDPHIVLKIREYYDKRSPDYSGPTDRIEDSCSVTVYSEDGLFCQSVSLANVDGDMILESVTGGGNMRGITVDKETADYVRPYLKGWE